MVGIGQRISEATCMYLVLEFMYIFNYVDLSLEEYCIQKVNAKCYF